MSSPRVLQRVSTYARNDFTSICLQCHVRTPSKHVANRRQQATKAGSLTHPQLLTVRSQPKGRSRLHGQHALVPFQTSSNGFCPRNASSKAAPPKTETSTKPRIKTIRASANDSNQITFSSADTGAKRPPDLASRAAAPAPATYNINAASVGDPNKRQIEHAKRLLGKEDEVMLYVAPSHKSLLITSLIGGTTFLMTCATAGQSMLMISDFPMLLRVPAVIGSVIGIAMSSAIFWTPLRQIQSLRLIRDGPSGVLMQVESKSRLLTGRKRRFNVPLGDIRSDRNIRASVVDYKSVERADAHKWTEHIREREALQRHIGSRIALAWKETNILGGLVNFWSSLKLNTSRMFARAGMTYIRIENQNWKLDLTNAYVLDRGFPISEIIKEDAEVRDSVIGIVRRHLSSMG